MSSDDWWPPGGQQDASKALQKWPNATQRPPVERGKKSADAARRNADVRKRFPETAVGHELATTMQRRDRGTAPAAPGPSATALRGGGGNAGGRPPRAKKTRKITEK